MEVADNFDVLVVGAGCAGLTTADVLSELGAKVLLIEQGRRIAPGPSTRNGGYVHGGGFHAAVIDDPNRAARTAQRCREGCEFYRTHHWMAIHHDAAPVRLLVRDKILADRALERWASFQIEAIPLSSAQMAGPEFEFRGNTTVAAYVKDLPINYAMVYQKLLSRMLRRGVTTWVGHRLSSYLDGDATITVADETKRVRVKQVVYCTGFETKGLLERNRDRWSSLGDTTVRLWKSHVVLTKRFTKFGYMIVDPGDVSVMPQGEYSVVCQSQEDLEVDAPNYDQVPSTVAGIKDRLNTTYTVPHLAAFQANACLKPSIHVSSAGPRSVDVHVIELSENEVLALPGKATEAPLMAAEVAATLQAMLTQSITKRPGDTYSW